MDLAILSLTASERSSSSIPYVNPLRVMKRSRSLMSPFRKYAAWFRAAVFYDAVKERFGAFCADRILVDDPFNQFSVSYDN